jgi:hypothetical protein
VILCKDAELDVIAGYVEKARIWMENLPDDGMGNLRDARTGYMDEG